MPCGRTSSCRPLWIAPKDLELGELAPTPSYARIRIGDVGFLRRGKFHLLFSAGFPLGDRKLGDDVPATFKQLDVGNLILDRCRPPGCLHTLTIREVGADLDVTGCTAT